VPRRRDAVPLPGRVVAITGGARGIGRAIAEDLVAHGARVAVGDLDLDGAQATATELGRGTVGLALDVTDRASITAFLASAEEALGAVDVLVNNAGVMHVGPFLEESDEWTRRQLDVNLLGLILACKVALPPMVARGFGHVVNVASVAAHLGVRHEAVYAATKWGVAGLTESLRLELRGSGVDLSLVMPGVVRTDLAAGTTDARGVKVLAPADVAAEVVAAIERPRFDVFVPRSYAALARVKGVLPRTAREAFLRLLGTERHTRSTTPADREAYERRVEELMSRREPHDPEPPAYAGGHKP
jgi:NADP-dependent 3-hydroxy acid dehydrogenase YdfG